MAAKENNQLLIVAGLAGAGYLAYRHFNPKTVVNADGTVTTDTSILPDLGAILSPPTNVTPKQTYTGAVPTPYGPVIPSFGFTTAVATQTQSAATTARMQDILYRHQYIYNSIAYGLAYGQSAAGAADSGLASRIATLRAKDAVLQAEWKTYTGANIPEGTLNTPEKKQAYIDFLRAHSWCDPLVGVPC